ncbi:hypothetical protein HFP89_11910 [Wenzhouxiangella sp. XN79A]|uniref:restriction endonuclease subunit S n=1 Tax=Wenzhouxiangella sp. XN79A TaxID=2724193 RepID=UPI00144A8F5C|nr:restriction endonuclease subunit S [Wenzhouxiangella sp. XN79A]NKI35868.1 hypothetical protein [Wenzhouxiangella sp. XN79A]
MEVRDVSAEYAPRVEMPVVPEGYKQSEVGVIPEDWEISTIGNLASIKTGPFGTLLKASEYSQGDGVPLISVGEIGSGKFRVSEHTPLVSEDVIRRLPQYVLKTGDIVFGRKGAVDRSARVTDDEDGWFLGSDGISVRPDKRNDSSFLAYQFQRHETQQWLLQNAVGTTMASLNQSVLGRTHVVLPPSYDEQRAIATALSDVDALLEALDRLIAKKRNIKQATMQQLLTAQTRLPGFEGQWAKLPLGDIVTFLSGGTPSRNNESFWAGDIPWISASTLRTFYICRSDSNVTKEAVSAGSKMAPIGSVLLLVRGSALHNEVLAGLVTKPVCFNQDVKALVPQARICGQFLALLMHGRAQDLLSLVSSAGNTAGVLDTKLIKAFEVQLPPLDEQVAIVTILADMDSQLKALQQRRTKTAALKQAMMQELLTGRMRLVDSYKHETQSC